MHSLMGIDPLEVPEGEGDQGRGAEYEALVQRQV